MTRDDYIVSNFCECLYKLKLYGDLLQYLPIDALQLDLMTYWSNRLSL